MLDIEGMAELSPLEQGRRQFAMQHAIQKAVKTVPVERLVAVSDTEVVALRAAIEEPAVRVQPYRFANTAPLDVVL